MEKFRGNIFRKISKIGSQAWVLWYRSRGESTSRKWTVDIFPKRLIDKPFSRAMVNQRAFGKTRGKLFILEKRSRWFIKSDSPKISNGIRRTSVYLSIIAFDLPPRSTLERRKWRRMLVPFFRIIFFNSNKLRSTISRLFNRIHFTSRCFLLLPVFLHDFLSLYIGVPLNIFFSIVFTAVQFSFPEHRVEWYSFNFRSPDGIHKVNRGKKRDSRLNNTTSHWALKAEDISFLIRVHIPFCHHSFESSRIERIRFFYNLESV